ncbi:GILT-like protein 1 [Orussus abietinus]|uniref:GILT-like protein 1 n=1 Tax=Orussus abietinus TaxID=222816 RepID=UPI0006255F5E|nr:GILT-like protein 1 [Orussus abietinus]
MKFYTLDALPSRSLITLVIIALTFHGSSVNGQGVNAKKVNVDLYYEALCPDSINWIKNQLVPNYGDLKEFIEITFVPYGKASQTKKEDGSWEFVCQHGPPECFGNKAQACALNEIQSICQGQSCQEMASNLVGCVMSSSYPSTAVEHCASKININAASISRINECEKNSKGDELLAAMGVKTFALQPRLSFVPTIVINKAFSQENQSAALKNFKKLVCDNIGTVEKPAAC